MNVASLPLCKELYELSGWDGVTQYHSVADAPDNIPAYDLGYLLRKLPNSLPFKFYGGNSTNPYTFQLRKNKAYWLACYPSTELQEAADTPEDAAAKLAIDLFKQGILKTDTPA